MTKKLILLENGYAVGRKITSMKKQARIFTLLISVLTLMIGYQNCSNSMKPMNLDQASLENDASGASLSELEATSLSILQNKCAACHTAGVGLGGIDYITDINALKYYRLIYPGEPAVSPLYVVLNTEEDHLQLLNQAESQVLFNWIQALAGSAGGITPPLDVPLNGTFSSISTKIFAPRCNSCHNATQRLGGLDLTNLSSVLQRVVAGNPAGSSLFIRVNNNSMPTTGQPLTAAEKQAIADWITAGAQNN